MKTRVPKVLIFLVPGIFALWTMTSLNLPNACESAGSNLEYIKEKIQEATTAHELQLSRYNTYKALNGLEKTKHNLQDCGCKTTQEHMDRALSQLKEAARADSLRESKELLGLALENTQRGLEALRDFQREVPGVNGRMEANDTAGIPLGQDWLLHIPDATVRKQVKGSLLAFESSLDSVLREVECTDARRFLDSIYRETHSNLQSAELSIYKKEYYLQLRTLIDKALEKLGDCGG